MSRFNAEFRSQAETDLVSDSPQRRLKALESLQGWLDEDILSHTPQELDTKSNERHNDLDSIGATLFRVYPFSRDSQFRAMILKILDRRSLYHFSPNTLLSLYCSECAKAGLMRSDALILVKWGCVILYRIISIDGGLSERVIRCLCALASAFEISQRPYPKSRRSISLSSKRSVVRMAHRLEKLPPEDLLASLSTCLMSAQSIGERGVPLLGLLLQSSNQQNDAIVKLKGQIYQCYENWVLNSKTPVQNHIAGFLEAFLGARTTVADLEKFLAPNIAKWILRTPEAVLARVAALVNAFDPAQDLSSVLLSTFMKPLLDASRSQNESVRIEVLETFKAFAKRCKQASVLENVAGQLMRNLVSARSVTEKLLLVRLVKQLPFARFDTNTIIDKLLQSVCRESNEAVLTLEATVMFMAYVNGTRQVGAGRREAIIQRVTSGLSAPKASSRNIWVQALGDSLWPSIEDPEFLPSHFRGSVDMITKLISSTFAENCTGETGTSATIAYISICLLQTRFEYTNGDGATNGTLTSCSNSSDVEMLNFVTNLRIYNKLDAQGWQWLIRALKITANKFFDSSSGLEAAWTETVLASVVASNAAYQDRRIASEMLQATYAARPVIVDRLMVSSLWSYLRKLLDAVDDGNVHRSQSKLAGIIGILTACRLAARKDPSSSFPQGLYQKQLISTLLICQPALVPRVSWTQSCISAGEDPGKLVNLEHDLCWQEVESALSSDSTSVAAKKTAAAAYTSSAELVFLSPQIFLPKSEILIGHFLNERCVTALTQEDIKIWAMPKGQLYHNPLQSHLAALEKESLDRGLQKREREFGSETTRRKGTSKKASDEQHSQLQRQHEIEDLTKAKVARIATNLAHGAGLIQALATGPPSDFVIWMPSVMQKVLEVVSAGGADIAGPNLLDATISCAQLASPRFGYDRNMIAIACLRYAGMNNLSSELCDEPLADLSIRLLRRLHFLGSQMIIDPGSLCLVLPLVFYALETCLGNPEKQMTQEDEEVLTLVLELLEMHSSQYIFPTLYRSQSLELLIRSARKFPQHHRLIKDALMSICHSIGTSLTSSEKEVLYNGILVNESNVRNAILIVIRDAARLVQFEFHPHLLLACYDEEDENAEIADDIWAETNMTIEPSTLPALLKFLEAPEQRVRTAAARAYSACVGNDEDAFLTAFDVLTARYKELAHKSVSITNTAAVSRNRSAVDDWAPRSGIAIAFEKLANNSPSTHILTFFDFILDQGALADPAGPVRRQMLHAAIAIIDLHGGQYLEPLQARLEKTLETCNQSSVVFDNNNEAVIILYGTLARHFKTDDSRLPSVVRRLLEALSTPSESIQYAIASCLPSLIHASSPETSEYIKKMLDNLLESPTFAIRRGAAYGLGGIVKGYGIAALNKFRILSTLKVGMENKKDSNQREACLFAIEQLSNMLGAVFEPYIIRIVPQLLGSFGDTKIEVRDACLDASRSCFSHLTSYGVKIILPTLLSGLGDDQWRTKKGACDLLGAMAYLNPTQLATNLPDIIPPITNAANDSHKEVRAAANRSLKRFGDVISSPEIKTLVGDLLKALSDPTKYTDDALQALIATSFAHYLDAPSLAFVVRILQRGLHDRSATKRKSAQIIGSLAHLTDRKDLVMHLPILLTGLKGAIIDPVPATRATASKAMGSLVERLGEDTLPDIIPDLMQALKADTGASDRLGSAQALSEVLAGLGTARLEEILPLILQNTSSTRPNVREGFLSLFIYLPACFGNSFANYLGSVISPILSGLADGVESIRETALRAARLLVRNFATKAIDLLLPELDRGLADENHRIRLSSVELVGDLLFNLIGINGRVSDGDDISMVATSEAGNSLLAVLGETKRNQILSSLYICRCDTSGLVRTRAISVWKALVASPKVLKELIPCLTQMLVSRLASANTETKLIAGNALGELIRKAGEGVLASLLPILEKDLAMSTDPDHRQGICIALQEIASSSAYEIMITYEDVAVTIIRTALVDPNHAVREAAADAFDALQEVLGKRAVNQVLPHLVQLLRSEQNADVALSALLTLLTDPTRSTIILPNLVPTLIQTPMTSFNAAAVASLTGIAGQAMNRRIPAILNALMDNIMIAADDDLVSDLQDAFDKVLCSVDEFDGLNTAMSIMLTLVKHNDHRRRAAANRRLASFFSLAEFDYSRYYQDLIRVFLIAFDDSDIEVVKAAWLALSELTKKLKREEMESLTASTRRSLLQVGVPGHDLPGFHLPKGISSVLPIFLQGLLNGPAEQRTIAALAISDILVRCNGEAIKPFVTQLTGPLIRVVSERSIDLKIAVLAALTRLLEKIPIFLKPFLPQLQRTFAKCLGDPSSVPLRDQAAHALGLLITLTTRIDPLITELISGSKTTDSGVRASMLKALYEVVNKAGHMMNENSRATIFNLIEDDSTSDDEVTMIALAKLLGVTVKTHPKVLDISTMIKDRVLSAPANHISILVLNALLVDTPSVIKQKLNREFTMSICQGVESKDPFISSHSILAAGKAMLIEGSLDEQDASKILEVLAGKLEPSSPTDARRLGLVVIRTVARINVDLTTPHLNILAPRVFANVRDPVIPIKLAAEAAFLALFSVKDRESEVFDEYIKVEAQNMAAGPRRSIQDYFKRVAIRLGSQLREKQDAESGLQSLGLASDEHEDEQEIWSIGKLDLKAQETSFNP